MSSSRTKPTPQATLEQWRERALAVPGEVLSASVPLPVLLDEAEIAAGFFRRRWKAVGDLPGLESAANAGFTAEAGADLLALRSAVVEADAAYRRVPSRPASPAARGRQVVRAIAATLAWYFDGDDAGPGRAQMEVLRRAHGEVGRSAGALAVELEAWAALAERYRAALEGLGGFEARQIDEARAITGALRERSPASRGVPLAKREALALRNKLVALLRDRLATLRAAARFVFRDHPAIAREATSEHERARRRAGRGAKKEPPP